MAKVVDGLWGVRNREREIEKLSFFIFLGNSRKENVENLSQQTTFEGEVQVRCLAYCPQNTLLASNVLAVESVLQHLIDDPSDLIVFIITCRRRRCSRNVSFKACGNSQLSDVVGQEVLRFHDVADCHRFRFQIDGNSDSRNELKAIQFNSRYKSNSNPHLMTRRIALREN